MHAAATVGIFNGLVRVADCTGIPLDDGTRDATVEERESLPEIEPAGLVRVIQIPNTQNRKQYPAGIATSG